MGEAVEQSFSGDIATSSANRPLGSSADCPPPAPLWRLRTALTPGAVRSLRSKIIPRILLAKKETVRVALDDAASGIADPIRDFAASTLSIDAHAASDFVDRLLASGVTVEAVFLQWLAPAARLLGQQWETDETDFANVTLGVNRLHMIMRRLGDDFCHSHAHTEAGGDSALLTVVPGEQHSFGLSMVAEFFRRAGWTLCTGPFATHGELTSLVHHHWFDIVGFSVSSDRRLDDLKRDIDAIRAGSRNRLVGIILGGPMLQSHPELVGALGADMMSLNAAQAPQEACGLIDRMKASSAG